MILFFTERIDDNYAYLSGDEHRHCAKVLRRQVGDIIVMTNGSGSKYTGQIADIGKKEVKVEITTSESFPPPPISLHIAIAPTKNNARLEWFCEKATEIGIQRITPILCSHSERRHIKHERLSKIVRSAAQQSLKFHFPIVDEMSAYTDMFANPTNPVYVAHYDADHKHILHSIPIGTSATIIIGPEGDFSPEEIDMAKRQQATFVNLSPHRLRTETAGLVACQSFHSLNV